MEWLSRLSVARLLKSLDICIGQPDLSAHFCQFNPEAHPIIQPHRGLQNSAHFSLRAAIVLHRADLQGTMRRVGTIAYSHGSHGKLIEL